MANATKRDINKLMKQSADLWVALTDIECNVNLIVAHLLESNSELKKLGIDLTDQQLTRLTEARKALRAFDGDIGALTQGE